MSEVMIKELGFKLFGKTIPLSANKGVVQDQDHPEPEHTSSTTSTSQDNKNDSGVELDRSKPKDDSSHPTEETLTEPTTSSGLNNQQSSVSIDKDSLLSPKTPNKEEPSESSLSQEKTLKKPDKIIPCPRCNSMDTKFCYYNNYNVSQPRHFCRNCQRYWTDGGTMRNVPVGSGRRKNKTALATSFRHAVAFDTFQAAQANPVNGINFQTFQPNCTIFMHSSDRKPLGEPISSASNLVDGSQNWVLNGFYGPEKRSALSSMGREIGTENSSGSCATTNSTEKESTGNAREPPLKKFQAIPSEVQRLPPYPQWSAVHWTSPVSPPVLGPPGLPVTFHPATPYWGYSIPTPWNVPAMTNHPASTSLGKHSREGDLLSRPNMGKQDGSEEKVAANCVLVPKTLKIDDPKEAAQSSIWLSLEIKNAMTDSTNTASHFKSSPSKFSRNENGNGNVDATSRILHANPAALSRSFNFRESA